MVDFAVKHVAGITPLILANPNDPAGFDRLLQEINEHRQTPISVAAATESARLAESGYFHGMERNLAHGSTPQIRSIISYLSKRFGDYTPEPLYKTGTLKKIFDYVAKTTRSMLYSEIAIMPQSFLLALETKERQDKRTLNIIPSRTSNDAGLDYVFGLIQLIEREDDPEIIETYGHNKRSLLSRGVMALDDALMSDIAPHHPQKMLEALQIIATASNHDVLHHYLNTVSKGDISREDEADFKPELRDFTHPRTSGYHEDRPLGMESTLILGHARNWHELQDTPAYTKLKNAIDIYFNELARISLALKADPTISPEQHHKIVDYFSTAVGFCLCRNWPLNDPLLQDAFSRMQAVDPNPSLVQKPDPAAIVKTLSHPDKEEILPKQTAFTRTCQNYERSGFPLNDPSNPYRSAKQIELVRMLPDITLVLSPAKAGSPEYKAQQRSDSFYHGVMDIFTWHMQ